MSSRPRILAASLAVAATVGATLVALVVPGSAGAAVPTTVSPVADRSASAVTATPLPTAQIDGIVWGQAVVGNTVYAGGKFSTARPAGVAVGGTGTVTRSNLVAYDITTGELTSFAPTLNGPVQTVTASPDGSRLYVGGQFTSVNGVPRYRIAAFDTATGALLPNFAPAPDYVVYAIAATATTVYVGGAFSSASGNARPYLAAFSASNGALLPWAPTANALVRALALSPDGSRVIVAGAFSSLNGTLARGLGSLDPATGATQPFAANNTVYSYGPKASFFSLAVSGNTVYGTSYNFGGSGNLEGSFAADASSGAITWIEDCHGDTYSVFPTPDQVYVVGHPHFCGNIGGYPDGIAQRAIAFIAAATGTIQPNSQRGYADLGGNPSPSLTTWFPTLDTGTVSGSNQAAWSVTGDNRYVVLGGEFTKAGGVPQQGLVRFAVPSVAPDKVAPTLGKGLVPSATALGSGALRLAFTGAADPDDLRLAYSVTRDTGSGTAQQVVWQTSAASTFWKLPALAVADTGLTPGTVYRYRVAATDPSGNQTVGPWTSITAPSSGSPGFNFAPTASATATVQADGATVAVDGSASSDPDGQVSRYAWDFGDGSTATTVTASHRYRASGTYRITLTVTDDKAATGSTTLTRTVTVAPTPPVAVVSTSVAGLSLTADGSRSTDADGRVAGYAWNFGDGTTGSGATATHVYAANGTYPVTLTVTDDSGLTDTATTSVTVASDAPVARDGFTRTVTSGWGSADTGGTWTTSGGAANFAVDGSQGTQKAAAAGATTTALLAGVDVRDVDLTVRTSVAAAASGNGTSLVAIARRTGSSDYRVKLRLLPGGVVHLAASVVVNGTETVLREINVTGLAYQPGDPLQLRVTVTGASPTTVTGTVWRADGTAPASPQLSLTDSTAGLTGSGAVGLQTYLASNATVAPVVAAYDDYVVRVR